MHPKDFKAEMRKTLEEWDDKIRDLRTKAENAGTEKKAELLREVEAVIEKKQAIEDKIEEMEQADVEDWREFMDGISHAAKDLQSTLDSAMSK
jgi:flagellar hook-basal body complex protein FliE